MKIAIASGKGGTGKTTVASNLSAFLSEQAQPVALVDLDVEEPNSGLFIQGDKLTEQTAHRYIPQWDESNCIFCNQCQSICNYNAIAALPNQILVFPELCHSCYACSELCPTGALPMKQRSMGTITHFQQGNLHLFEGLLNIGEQQSPPMIAETKDYAAKNLPGAAITIYDAPPGTSCPVIEATKGSDYVILVTEPTPFGLHDLKLSVETMRKTGHQFGVVINRYDEQNKLIDTYCDENNIPVIGKIPDKREIAELYSTGQLIYRTIASVQQALRHIHEKISKTVQQQTP
jgi:MinD superfamily P-loop ATPase